MNSQQDKQKEALMTHAQLFQDALERAKFSPEGVWVNGKSATEPKFYQRQGKISAFSSLLMAMHSQLRNCSVNTYISYSDAVSKGIRFGQYNSGIQIPYVRQEGYRNRLTNELISKEQFDELSREEGVSYRPNFQRFLRMVYNMDQTDIAKKDPETYKNLIRNEGPESLRGVNSLEQECDVLCDFDADCSYYEKNLVGMMPTDQNRTHYDPEGDMIAIACVDSYPSTDAFLQDAYRAIATATATPSRLDRNVSTEGAMLYEKLLQECISAQCMVRSGRTAAIAPENMELIPQWKQMIANNPRVIYSLERDINLANEMFLKALAGQKVVKDLNEKSNLADMPVEDMLALKNILSSGGMATNPLNSPSVEAYNEMLEKYGLSELASQIEQCHGVLRDNESLKAKGMVSEDTYIQTKSEMYKELSKLGAQMSARITAIIPRPWDYYGNRYITKELESLAIAEPNELVLIHEPQNKIVNVLLPHYSRNGGMATLATGEKVGYWLDPLEQITPEELKGATLTKADPDWLDKEKVAQSIKELKGAKLVRFYETEGPLGFYPPNEYYNGKEVSSCNVIDKEKVSQYCTYDIAKTVKETCDQDFESISVIKDENGSWVMNLRTTIGENFSIYPTQADLKIFFEQCRDLTEDSLATKRALAQKYYNLAIEEPRLNVDIFYQIPQGIDPECIERVYIFKDPKFGIQMLKPNIKGVDQVQARPISKSQFQKLWIAPDVDRYRKALACRVFEDILPRTNTYDNGRGGPGGPGASGGAVLLPTKTKEKEEDLKQKNKGYPAVVTGFSLADINTQENNRNFRKGNSDSKNQSQINSQTKKQSQQENSAITEQKPKPSHNESQNQTKSQTLKKSKEQNGSQSLSDPQSQDNTKGKDANGKESLNKSDVANSNSKDNSKDKEQKGTSTKNPDNTPIKDNTQRKESKDSKNESMSQSETQTTSKEIAKQSQQKSSPTENAHITPFQDNTKVKDAKGSQSQSDSTNGQSVPKYVPQEQQPPRSKSTDEVINQSSSNHSTSSKPVEQSLFVEEDIVENEGKTANLKSAEQPAQGPVSYSQSNSESKDNKVQEPSAAYNAGTLFAELTSEEEAKLNKGQDQSQPQTNSVSQNTSKGKELLKQEPGKEKTLGQKNEQLPTSASSEVNGEKESKKQPFRRPFYEVDVSPELYKEYEKLRHEFPDTFIFISQDGWAKALDDNAFQAYDIIHDGHPIVFVNHPFPDRYQDRIAVYEIPESQARDEFDKLMEHNTSVLFCRMEDVLAKEKERQQGLTHHM